MAADNAQDSVDLRVQGEPPAVNESLNYFRSQHESPEDHDLIEDNSQLEPGSLHCQATAESLSSVVYTDGVGMSDCEAIRKFKADLYRMEELYDREKSKHISQIEAFKHEIEGLEIEKATFIQQFADATDQLKKSIEDGHAKDEQLNTKEEELKSSERELKLKKSELNDLTEKFQANISELSEKLASKENEFQNNMQKFQQKKEELKVSIAKLEDEIKMLKANKTEVEQQLAVATDQLSRSTEDSSAKDELLAAKEKEIEAKDQKLELQESESSDLAENLQTKIDELSEKLAAKETEFSSKMKEAQQEKDDLEKELKENIATLEAEIERLKTDKTEVERQLAIAKDGLTKSIKDEQLTAKKKGMEAKDEKLRLKESELSDLVEMLPTQLSEMLVAKKLNEKEAELTAQKEVTETLKREKEVKELELKYEIMLRDQKIKFSEERQQMKDLQHQLELQVAVASKNNDLLKEREIRTHENDGQEQVVPVPEDSGEISIAGPNTTFWTKRVLGGGAFGKVYEGLHDGEPCAVKILNELAMELISELPTSLRDEKMLQQAIDSFTKEGECLKQLKHENVVKLHDIRPYPKGNYPVIVMEKLNCSLSDYFTLPGGQDITVLVQLSFSCDVASALEYLHHKKIIHRDLCGDNILLNTQPPIPVAKVSDFGMSRILKDFERMSTKLTSIVGHRVACYPPEVQDDPESYDMSIDIFMFGVVMLQIAHKISRVKSPKRRRELVDELSESHALKKHIQHCVEIEKNKRPTAKAVHTELKKRYENLRHKDQIPQTR